MRSPADFRSTLRRGRRVSTSAVVLHVLERDGDESRFGFIVSKSVGNAVTRNVVRRRLRAVSRDLLPSLSGGRDVVMRALPGSDQVEWANLHAQISDGLRSVKTR